MTFPALAASDDFAERAKAEHRFEMVLVPGDVAKGIEPFYLSQTEVRLEMFYPWATGDGMGWSSGEVAHRLGFYPSECFGFYHEYRHLYDEQYPALAMSRTVAELYCETLSELTGRRYRLPTEDEWELALKQGGGVPEDREALLRVAHLETEESWTEGYPFGPVPARVGTQSADRLGLHDMIGNAAEWVADTGADRVVRGGHFELPAEDFKLGWRVVEDIEVWNGTHPQIPLPRSWYRDFPYTGIRLACDVDQAPEE